MSVPGFKTEYSMTVSNLIDWVLVIYGFYLILGVVIRPPMFWDSKRMKRRRALIGDRRTTIMYGVLATIMILLGGVNLIGLF